MVRRMKSRAGVKGIHGPGIAVAGQETGILGHRTIRPAIDLPDSAIDRAGHDAGPGFAPIQRAEDPAPILTVLGPPRRGHIEDRGSRPRVGAAGEGKPFAGGEPPVFDLPAPAAVVAAKEPRPGSGIQRAGFRAGATAKMESQRRAGQRGTDRPMRAAVGRQRHPLVHPHQHAVRLIRIDRDFSGQSRRQIADRREMPAAIAGDAQFTGPSVGGEEGVGFTGMKSRPAPDIAPQLPVVDETPGPAAITGEIGTAHIAVEHHAIGIERTDGGREHRAAPAQPGGLPGEPRGVVRRRRLPADGGKNQRPPENPQTRAAEPAPG